MKRIFWSKERTMGNRYSSKEKAFLNRHLILQDCMFSVCEVVWEKLSINYC